VPLDLVSLVVGPVVFFVQVSVVSWSGGCLSEVGLELSDNRMFVNLKVWITGGE